MAGTSPKRRRILLVAGLVAAAIIIFVVIPGYLGSRPAHFANVPGFAEKYEPWSTSTHVKARCEGCHVSPRFFARTAYYARMTGDFYLSLVSRSHTPDAFERPTNAACLSCHDDLRSVSPKGDLKIPHKAHVNILKMDCVQCHDYLVHEKSPEGGHTPTMAGCLKCHDGDTAKNSCDACHTQKATPATHKSADWLVVHGDRATAECDECHAWTAKWCVDCHSRRPRSHTADWRKTHGDQVLERRNCEACHEAEFCIRCHGVLPPQNLDPTQKLVQ